MNSRCIGRNLLVLLCLSFLSAGCTKTYKARVSRFELGTMPPMIEAPLTGVYVVQWTPTPGRDLRKLEGTETLVVEGEPVGFEMQDDQTVVAVAGRKRIVMEHLPEEARLVIWYHKGEHQTQFGKEVGEAMQVAAGAATVGALVVGTGALIGTVAYLEGLNESDCDDRRDGW